MVFIICEIEKIEKLNETKMCEVKPDEDNMMSRSCSNDNDNT
jgi:hypothetical protein